MKLHRKNIDLDSTTIAVLQIEGTMKDYSTLKPFLEALITKYAQKCIKSRPNVYKGIIERKSLNSNMKIKAGDKAVAKRK